MMITSPLICLSVGLALALAAGSQDAPGGAPAETGKTSEEPPRVQPEGDPPFEMAFSDLATPLEEIKLGPVGGGKADNPAWDANTVSIDFTDAEISDVIFQVSNLYDLNVIVAESLKGSVSVKLNHVTWEEVFDVVLAVAKPVHTFRIDGNLVYIEKRPHNLIGGDPEIAFLIAAIIAICSLVANAFLFAQLKRRPGAGAEPAERGADG